MMEVAMPDVESVLRQIFAGSVPDNATDTDDAEAYPEPERTAKVRPQGKGKDPDVGAVDKSEGEEASQGKDAKPLVNLIADAVIERLTERADAQRSIAGEVLERAERLIPDRLRGQADVNEILAEIVNNLDGASLSSLRENPAPLVALAVGEAFLRRTRGEPAGEEMEGNEGNRQAFLQDREQSLGEKTTPMPEQPRARPTSDRVVPRTAVERQVYEFYRSKGWSDKEIKREFGGLFGW